MITYYISPNRVRPSIHIYRPGAFYNTVRRCRDQVFNVVPPLVVRWLLMKLAEHRNRYLNSKEGRADSLGAEG
ncbi:hypothetical protein K469DRAFT_624424 [Zopfia rhizophila CBS 207.26]|uniref:Cytochrome b-c1 complex subunit 8 n=1 Tax=Zopfia rhizophila CBS 207.26 TaxID=1314779 RepID=A0A6A6EH72_9PEZI|nr:hypothetical protein K469DRAFT_624424 [Zopfia rhizophila CBS 207.26]